MNTTRYGNKSVIAQIREDEDMPYTHDGRRVDLLLNLLAIINRTTAMPLFEMFINGCSYQVRQKMKEMASLEEKENTLFTFVRVMNEDQADKMYKNYLKMKKPQREAYVQDAIDNGIYIHQTPMWEKMPIFYRCMNLKKEFPFIKRDDLYVKKWGREYKCLTKYFIGEMYCMKLKQSDRRGFSARSTGAVDSKGLPTRSFKAKSHQERISSSCIRFGEFESLNFSIGILPEDIAIFHGMYRTSIKGRRDLVSMMFGEDGVKSIDASYTSRVSEIFNVILKSLGIGLNFVDEEEEVLVLDDNTLKEHHLNDEVYFCTDYQFFLIERIEEVKQEILEEHPILTENQLKKMIEHELKTRSYINGPIYGDLEGFEDALDQTLNETILKHQDELIASANEEEPKTDTITEDTPDKKESK